MKPLSLLGSIPLFAIPSLVMAAVVYGTTPYLDRQGYPLIWVFTGQVCAVLGGLGLLAIWAARRDRTPGESLARRLRLAPLRWSDVGLGLVIGIAGLGGYLAFGFTGDLVMKTLNLSQPAWLARFYAHGRFLDVPVAGALWLLPTYAVIYLCNVVGEELWWRGYILPKQALGMGGFAWLAQAVLWCAFHAFFPWDVLVLLPIALLISLVAQWRRSTWIGLVGHGVLNLPPFLLLAHAVLM
jgi:membrane protease YdiL (CAAX protease family)